MKIKVSTFLNFILFFFFFFLLICFHQSQAQPSTTGYTCNPNQTVSPCQTYAFYRASPPNLLDLASIADLFSVSRLMISEPSNIPDPASTLVPNQALFIPITCSCNTLNASHIISFANLSYTIKSGDTFYSVSTALYQNLTTYQSVELVNPTLVPTQLQIGQVVVFPIFCKCPSRIQMRNSKNYLVSYVLQPSDNLSAVASTFRVRTQDIIDVNENNIKPFDTIFIPVNRIPGLTQPEPVPVLNSRRKDRKGAVITGLAVGLGVCGVLLILVAGVWVYREGLLRKRRDSYIDEERQKLHYLNRGVRKDMEVSLMADVSDCLDKYRLFKVEELREATDGFSEGCLIHGSVYKGTINGEVYAIKMMNWNACDELKILQKVNHGNLVKLEGFCINPEDANCYLIYEYIENGSLHNWLHGNNKNTNRKLSWKTRSKIAVDVANGLQYIHEHTRPRVVHKDIKSSNILLDSNMRAKIANFGLAKSGLNAITMHIVGTQGYIPPEYLADGVVSTKTDVFSFGVVLLELVSGREAVDEEGRALWASVEGILGGNDDEEKVRKVKGFMDEVLLGQDGLCPMDSVMNVMAIAVACLSKDPTKRPSMLDVVYALSKCDDWHFDISDDGFSTGSQVVGR